MAALAKGLGKISDYAKPFDGSKPSEFGQFVKDFERAARTLDIHPTKFYLVFINCLEGRPQDNLRQIFNRSNGMNSCPQKRKSQKDPKSMDLSSFPYVGVCGSLRQP